MLIPVAFERHWLEVSMKRFLVLLLALGVLVVADRTRLVVADEKKDKVEKEDKDKKDDKDKDKDKDSKKDDKDAKKDDKDAKKDKEDKDKEKPVDKPLTEDQKKELEKLSGTFKIKQFEREGKAFSKDEIGKMKVVQKGAEWTFHLGDDSTQGKDVPYPDKKPKEIDSVYLNGPANGKTVKGIYKVDGDTVTYCWAEPDKARPKDFTTKEKDGLTLMVLEKVTKDEEDKDKDKSEKKDKDKEEKDKSEKKDKEDKKDK